MLRTTANDSKAGDGTAAAAQSLVGATTGPLEPRSDAESEKLAKKLYGRRFRWTWNERLAIITIVIAVLLTAGSLISYKYHSAQIAGTFLSRARVAGEQQEFGEQAKWLRRYSLLNPDDTEVLVKMALAADEAADHAPPERRGRAIYDARKRLGESIARLGSDSPEQTKELRARLIARLLQLGSLGQAEEQIVAYQAAPDDPLANGWLAQALYGQVVAGSYVKRRSRDSNADYWYKLANENVGQVLVRDVSLNPRNLESNARLLDAFQNHPEVFERDRGAIDAQRDEALKKRVERSLAVLEENEDSRSKLMLYQYLQSAGRDDEALEKLLPSAEQASERLASLEPSQVEASPAAAAEDQPEHVWDFMLVGEAARRSLQTNPQQAQQWYNQLIALDLPDIPESAQAALFVNAGMFHQASGNRERAIEVWELGLDKVGANDLDLLGRLATVRSQEASDERAEESIAQFLAAITAAERAFNRMTDREITSAQRTALNQRIEAARWQLNRVEANLAINAGRTMEAIQRLDDALNATIDVDPRELVEVARILAGIHGSEGTWDLASAALNRALRVAPSDAQLRAEAALAATRAGNRRQAMDQWRVAATLPSFETQLQSAQAMFSQEMRTAPDLRDFSGVRGTIDRLRASLRGLESKNTQDEDVSENIRRVNARLDILQVSLPPLEQGVTLEQHLQSSEMSKAAAELAEKYDQDPVVQAFASERLAATGQIEEANRAIAQLESIVGPEASALAIAKAVVTAASGSFGAAAESLMAQAERDSDRAAALLTMAAGYAQRERNNELAYRALSSIPEDQQNLTTLFSLARLAPSLPKDSEFLSVGSDTQSPAELMQAWQDRLRSKEGNGGSYWRFLEASRIVDQLRQERKRIQRNDARLLKAQELVRAILSQRPAWGEAIALNGWLYSLQGDSERAVAELREGIAAGDSRLQSRFLLWQELTKLGRYSEADSEIRLGSFAADTPVEQFAGLRISLAQRDGDFSRGVELAKEAVEEDPQDFLKRVLLCQTALQAAAKSVDAEHRAEWTELAKQSSDEAARLAGRDEPAVFIAKLGVAMLAADKDAIRAMMKTVDDSQLDQYAKHILVSQSLQALGDAEGALERWELADQLRPSVELKLQLATAYARLNRSGDQIAVLRQARQLRPNDSGINSKLALALVAREGEGVAWDEISDLLSSGQGVTPGSQLLYAFLLSQRSDDQQQQEGLKTLRGVFREGNSLSDDAARLLAGLLRKRMEASGDNDPSRSRWDGEIRTLYEFLIQQRLPLVVDLFNYADYLLAMGGEEAHGRVEELLDKLRSMKVRDASFAALSASLRLAQSQGDQDSVPQIVDAWVAQATKSGSLDEAAASAAAGASLLKYGFFDKAVECFQRVYLNDPDALTQYVIALTKANQFDECIEVCTEHFKKYGDKRSATLMVEALMSRIDRPETSEHQQLIKQALQKYGDHVPLIESVATLRMLRADYDGSIAMYQEVLKRSPTRLRALNNLAMALSEIPGREAEGIKPIEQAIKLAGEIPELLDTKGVVLLRSGRFEDAQAAFQQAVASTAESRFQFHLAVALLAQGKMAEAKQSWAAIDHSKLDVSALTPAEQQQLEEMKQEFGT